MRIFNTYGTGASLDDNRVVCSMIRRALSSDNIIIFGSGDQIRTFCWAGDVAEAMDRWMQMGRVECGTIALDIGGHYEISILRLANLIVELTGSSSQVVHCDSRSHDYRRKVPDLMLAHRLLGWLPSMPLSDGLTLTINDMRHRMQAQARQLSWIDIQ
jgi:nucleoside-diphosphate-sugar epimerase